MRIKDRILRSLDRSKKKAREIKFQGHNFKKLYRSNLFAVHSGRRAGHRLVEPETIKNIGHMKTFLNVSRVNYRFKQNQRPFISDNSLLKAKIRRISTAICTTTRVQNDKYTETRCSWWRTIFPGQFARLKVFRCESFSVMGVQVSRVLSRKSSMYAERLVNPFSGIRSLYRLLFAGAFFLFLFRVSTRVNNFGPLLVVHTESTASL